jgi:hypothetical protein
MNFLHWKVVGQPGDTVRIKTDVPANIRLLDALNFEYYQRGSKYQGDGGWNDALTAVFGVPYKGTFHAVVDLGGQPGLVKATCDIKRG